MIVLFLVALVSPRRSKLLQGSFDRMSQKTETKAGDRGGRLGDVFSTSMKQVRRAVDKSADLGRKAHEKLKEKRDQVRD